MLYLPLRDLVTRDCPYKYFYLAGSQKLLSESRFLIAKCKENSRRWINLIARLNVTGLQACINSKTMYGLRTCLWTRWIIVLEPNGQWHAFPAKRTREIKTRELKTLRLLLDLDLHML